MKSVAQLQAGIVTEGDIFRNPLSRKSMINRGLKSCSTQYKLAMRIFFMSSVTQLQAEIVMVGIFLRNPVLKEIFVRMCLVECRSQL